MFDHLRGGLQGLYQYDEQGLLREQKVQFVRPASNAFKVQRHYHYDTLGNLSKLEGGTRYHYDCQHQLVRLEKYDGILAEYKTASKPAVCMNR